MDLRLPLHGVTCAPLYMIPNEVILITEDDKAIGTMEKMEAHRRGVLHRAFSVFVFDRQGNMLLQQRSAEKYHGALLWSNTCCSHPYPGEEVEMAALRRLKEEMGFTTPLEKIFTFTYQAEVENNLVEHEFDHVFAGIYEGKIALNPAEVAAFQYLPMEAISRRLKEDPGAFTSWFRIAFPLVEKWWEQRKDGEVEMLRG
jgi:isopentenyl-diphosphate Delta-isomerase